MEGRAPYIATDIASWIVQRNDFVKNSEDADSMSLLKLMKLVYYAEGCSLALDNGSLYDEEIVAWEHGPVVRSVWEKYKNYTNKYDIEADEADELAAEKITKKDADVLEEVFDTFGVYSAWGLRNKTHEEDPWIIATENGKKMNGIIDRELIKKYFKEHYVK